MIACLLFTFFSCSKDILKETVISNIGNDYINTPKGFEDGVRAAYSSLRTFYGTQLGLTLTEFGTDIYATGADGGYKGFHFYDAQLQPTVDYLFMLWDEYANEQTEQLTPAAQALQQSLKKRIKEIPHA